VTDRPGDRPHGANDAERFEDLKDAYALGALPEAERRWFEGYLAANPELSPEVEDLVSAANLLALAPGEVEPPPNLRRNLLARIGGDASSAYEAQPEPSRPSGPSRWVRSLAAAAAILAVVGGLSAWNLSLRGENEDLRESYEDLQGQVEDRQTYRLSGPGGEGEVVRLEDGRGVLVAQNLEEPPEGKVYEAWVLRDGVPEPAGLFVPSDGRAAVAIEASLEGADAVAVTVEPEGGSPMPTSDVLLTAEI
jgi:anti-sigma-K factor RskA